MPVSVAWDVPAAFCRSLTTVLAAVWEAELLPDCTAFSNEFRSVWNAD